MYHGDMYLIHKNYVNYACVYICVCAHICRIVLSKTKTKTKLSHPGQLKQVVLLPNSC